MRRLLSILFALLLTLALALPVAGLGEAAEGTVADAAYEGIYEGEYNANGLRSGYGTWTYHNYLYVGQWENNMPKVDGIPVTAIGAWAFSVCEDFTGVSIPKGVTSIGDYAFQGCNGLTSLSLPEGVTNIGEKAFQWCSKVKKVSLPASLTSVGAQAFADCPSAKLSVAKKNETFEIRDGVLFDKVQNRVVD